MQDLLTLPTAVYLGKTKVRKCSLNLNIYRNNKPIVNANAKIAFEKAVAPLVETLPRYTVPIELEFTYYRASRRRFDVSNVCSIIDKYFCDTLKNMGKIPDDSFEWIKQVTYTAELALHLPQDTCTVLIYPTENMK